MEAAHHVFANYGHLEIKNTAESTGTNFHRQSWSVVVILIDLIFLSMNEQMGHNNTTCYRAEQRTLEN